MHVLDHAFAAYINSVCQWCLCAGQACFPLAKLGHQRADLTDALVLAGSCGLMLTVKGMFMHTL